MITLERKELRDACAGLSKVVPRRRTLPILQNARLETKDGKLLVSATDLDQHLIRTCATLQVAGSLQPFTLAMDQLGLFTTGPDKDPISFLPGQEQVTVRYPVAGQVMGRNVPTLPVDEWPAFPPAVDVWPVDPAFLSQLRRVAPFASVDASRAILSCVQRY